MQRSCLKNARLHYERTSSSSRLKVTIYSIGYEKHADNIIQYFVVSLAFSDGPFVKMSRGRDATRCRGHIGSALTTTKGGYGYMGILNASKTKPLYNERWSDIEEVYSFWPSVVTFPKQEQFL